MQFNYIFFNIYFYKNILLIISCSILGHEGIIEVIDHTRPTGAKLKKGDRLTFHVVNCCGECESCKDISTVLFLTCVLRSHILWAVLFSVVSDKKKQKKRHLPSSHNNNHISLTEKKMHDEEEQNSSG